jgi:hypothetical protein
MENRAARTCAMWALLAVHAVSAFSFPSPTVLGGAVAIRGGLRAKSARVPIAGPIPVFSQRRSSSLSSSMVSTPQVYSRLACHVPRHAADQEPTMQPAPERLLLPKLVASNNWWHALPCTERLSPLTRLGFWARHLSGHGNHHLDYP